MLRDQIAWEMFNPVRRGKGSMAREWGTQGPTTQILIRLLVGGVFLTAGLQKLLFPGLIGAGRFADLGFPVPGIIATLIGSIEIVAGSAVLLGLATRLAAYLLLGVAIGAIIAVDFPVLLNQPIWVFPVPDRPRYGVWAFFTSFRENFAMLIGTLYLIIASD